jgi:hypothetical protein
MKILFKLNYAVIMVFFFSEMAILGCPIIKESKFTDYSTNEDWLEKLPACPCESPDKYGIKLNDGWAKDKGNINKYHQGATESFRSYPAILTSEGHSGQQCCYDKNGNLITEGRAAGTPDKENTCDGENSEGIMTIRFTSLLAHYYKDVKPWEEFGGIDSGWIKYNKIWKPNNKNNCPINTGE